MFSLGIHEAPWVSGVGSFGSFTAEILPVRRPFLDPKIFARSHLAAISWILMIFICFLETEWDIMDFSSRGFRGFGCRDPVPKEIFY